MSGWTGRSISLVLAVGAIALAGCGSSSNQSSAYTPSPAARQYFRQVASLFGQVKAASRQAANNPTDLASMEAFSQTAKQAADTFNTLTPPASSLKSTQQALAASLSGFSGQAAKLATDLKNKTKFTPADLASFKAAGQQFDTATIAYLTTVKSELRAAGVSPSVLSQITTPSNAP